MSTEMEFDPERKLWKPGRRSFLFMFGAAVVAPMLPKLPVVEALVEPVGVSRLITSDLVTKELAFRYMNTIRYKKALSRSYSDSFIPTEPTILVNLPKRFYA